jgi:hypothetical protein
MKRIMIALTAVTLSCSAMAQTKMADTSMHRMSYKSMKKMNHSAVMMDGKMRMIMHGKSMPMTKTMTMSNGTMVMTDGTVKMKDGKTMMLKEGQCVNMNGNVTTMPMKHAMMDDKMKM